MTYIPQPDQLARMGFTPIPSAFDGHEFLYRKSAPVGSYDVYVSENGFRLHHRHAEDSHVEFPYVQNNEEFIMLLQFIGWG
jgi:hypothetical protein